MSEAQHGAVQVFLAEVRVIFSYFQRVWNMVPRRHKLALGSAALIMAVVSGCNTLVPLLLGRMIDRVQHGLQEGTEGPLLYETITLFLALIAAAYFVREVLNVVRRYLVENACTRLEKTMKVNLVSHLMKMRLSTLSKEKVGSLQSRIGRNVVGFVRFLRLGFLDLFPPLATGTFALAVAVTKQPLLAVIMIGVVPLSLYLTLRQIQSQKGVRLKLMRNREMMDGTVVELLGGLDFVRAANTQDFEIKRISKAAERLRALEARHHFQMSLYGFAKAMNEGFFHVAVLALALYMAMHGTISVGDVFTFSMLFLNVMAPLNEVHRGVDEGHECSLQVADLMEMLAEPTDPSFSPADVTTPRMVPGQPVLLTEDLTVHYHTPIGVKRGLEKVTTEVIHGETIGLAGPSGCGKSTWLKVLLRLVPPAAGRVEIGGVPIERVSREAIGRLFGYVGQNPFVFAGSIAENIAYGVAHATPDAIEDAARRACIHDEIMAMPGGYKAEVSERGMNLSGGQRQRLALARVFLKNPPVLILDEGTSALDTISERNIQRAIDLARRDRTVILVAHRLTTLLDADRIFVFRDGQVVEEGSYAELYARGGFFAELVNCAETGTTENGAAVPQLTHSLAATS